MASTPQNRTDVPAADARSWLLVSAAHSRHFTETHTGAADAVIYDLEDGVVPSARPTAREALHLWFSRGGTGWVRVNPPAPRTGAMTSTQSRQHPGSWA
nr:hypothetical protein [Rhodococcus opacus]